MSPKTPRNLVEYTAWSLPNATFKLDLMARHLHCMRRWKIPGLVLQILMILHRIEGWVNMSYDGAEWFCGEGWVEDGMRQDALCVFGYDVTRGKHMDFTSPCGLAYAVGLSRRLKERSCNHWDTVCSSFVWMSQKHCARSLLSPLGNSGCYSTYAGNLMVVRMIVLSLYHLSKLSVFLLEQPSSSIMRAHPRFKCVRKLAIANGY